MSEPYRSLIVTPRFLEDLIALAPSDQKRVARAMKQLDINEKTPGLRVHELQGDLRGVWSASASDKLRLTFLRAHDGRKILLNVTHHYGN